MGFDKDAELDPRLSSTGATALLALYEEQFQGFQLIKTIKTQSQNDADKKLVPRIDKAMKAALADLDTLASGLGEVPPEPSDDDPAEEPEEGAKPSVEGVPGEAILRELYWRLHSSWSSASAEARADIATNLKMVVVAGGTPSWTDLATLMAELTEIDREAEGENFPTEWYEDLLQRFENKLGKKKSKKKTTKSEPILRTPPPDATIIDYSAKGTFHEGDWVSHPKFGTGIVVESTGAANVLIEFGPEQKRLAHVPPTTAPSAGPRVKTKTTADTLELARAAGIEIKKIPARVEDEDK